MEDKFLNYLDSIIEWSESDIFIGTTPEEQMQIKVLKQVREKYLKIRSENINTAFEKLKK